MAFDPLPPDCSEAMAVETPPHGTATEMGCAWHSSRGATQNLPPERRPQVAMPLGPQVFRGWEWGGMGAVRRCTEIPGGELFEGVFFLAGQNWGGKFLVLLLRNEGKIWYEAPCCCIIVDGCAVRDMWKPLVAEKIFIKLDVCDEK